MNLSLGIKMLVVVICTLLSIIIGIVAGLLMHPLPPPRLRLFFLAAVSSGVR